MLIKGENLNREQRKAVFNAFIYRWTVEMIPRDKEIYGSTSRPTLPRQTDNEWLQEHAFHFVKDGSRLMANRHHAEPAFLAD